MPANREGRFGATRPYISNTASQYVTADRTETTAAFTTSLEINPIFPPHPNLHLSHKIDLTSSLRRINAAVGRYIMQLFNKTSL